MKWCNQSFLFFFCFIYQWVDAQNLSYAKYITDTLCSPYFNGRGYVKQGDKISANFISREFETFHLKSFPDPSNKINAEGIFMYRQSFPIAINTFPANTTVKVGKYLLEPGIDYLVSPNSGSGKGSFKIKWLNKEITSNPRKFRQFQRTTFKNRCVFIDTTGIKDEIILAFIKTAEVNLPGASAVVKINYEKLSWHQSSKSLHFPLLLINRTSVPAGVKKINIDIKNQLLPEYYTQNVIGFLQGQSKNDSFIVFTAHYDHLGSIGNTYFPGANDNASGIAMLLNLAKYYSANKNTISHPLVFIAFGGEELNLSGSKYFTENPLFDLKKIKFLINLDLVGTGDKGIVVVNGNEFQEEFNLLKKINDENNYFHEVRSRGKARNSDHYYFTEKGVKSFFIYTFGGANHYHDLKDTSENLTLSGFASLFKIIVQFVKEIEK